MEQKYTPAPWFAVDYAGSFCIQNGPMYDDTDLLCYDSIFSDIVPPSKDVVEANAKLMAAAPEMLKDLKSLILSIESHPDYVTGEEGDEWHTLVSMALETIEKAE